MYKRQRESIAVCHFVFQIPSVTTETTKYPFTGFLVFDLGCLGDLTLCIFLKKFYTGPFTEHTRDDALHEVPEGDFLDALALVHEDLQDDEEKGQVDTEEAQNRERLNGPVPC